MPHLDEKGFVFIDEKGDPYLCKVSGGVSWFFYWQPERGWVSSKKCNQMEVWLAHEKALPPRQAEIYHLQAELALV